MWRHLREGLLFAAVLACLLPAASAAAASPTKVLASILDAGHAKSSLHYTSKGNYGAVQVNFVGDARAGEGIQQITYSKAKKSGHVTVIVSANTAYVRGDAFTLANYIGFEKAAASKYAGEWVRFPNTDTGYATVAAGVTLSAAVDELKLEGRLSRVPATTIDGRRVLGVRGTQSAAGKKSIVDTIYAQASGSPLPVKEVVTQGASSLIVNFSAWNQHFDLAAPKTSVPISEVRKASSPPSPGLVA
jgi:hypothetical protein